MMELRRAMVDRRELDVKEEVAKARSVKSKSPDKISSDETHLNTTV
jgi:hypothetical protein